jgi:hypothetical protein
MTDIATLITWAFDILSDILDAVISILPNLAYFLIFVGVIYMVIRIIESVVGMFEGFFKKKLRFK